MIPFDTSCINFDFDSVVMLKSKDRGSQTVDSGIGRVDLGISIIGERDSTV